MFLQIEFLYAFGHPRLVGDVFQPVLHAGNPAQIFLDVLFADQTGGDFLPGTVGDGDAEDRLGHEDALSVMAQGAMAPVGVHRLAGVEPAMNGDIIFRLAAEATGGRSGMVIWVRHDESPFGDSGHSGQAIIYAILLPLKS